MQVVRREVETVPICAEDKRWKSRCQLDGLQRALEAFIRVRVGISSSVNTRNEG